MDQTLALAITKAIGLTENGGTPDLQHLQAGKSGEMKSIFQFTPATWKNYAQQIAGNPNLPLTPDNETRVVAGKVEKWLQEGYKPEQIFSMWNAGTGEPDAYTGKFSDGQPSVGKNKYGVHYDVPSYVLSGMKHLKQVQPEIQMKMGQGGAQSPFAGNVAETKPGQSHQKQSPQAQHGNPLEDILTALQSKINPKSTPTATHQPSPKSGGLVASLLSKNLGSKQPTQPSY